MQTCKLHKEISRIEPEPSRYKAAVLLTGEIKTSYQKRWFVLKGNLLFYKDRPGDKDLIGVIVLEGCTVQLCESEEQFAFSIVWSEPGLRTYKFAAEDQASQESWIKALLSASHSYLALLVTDMEKQYKGEGSLVEKATFVLKAHKLPSCLHLQVSLWDQEPR
uniref:PH domain-containing protein n=1 Tax=Cyprinodon variegatus TaxID=28743 RepID=A0A3Q2DRZ2_CYPVA